MPIALNPFQKVKHQGKAQTSVPSRRRPTGYPHASHKVKNHGFHKDDELHPDRKRP